MHPYLELLIKDWWWWSLQMGSWHLYYSLHFRSVVVVIINWLVDRQSVCDDSGFVCTVLVSFRPFYIIYWTWAPEFTPEFFIWWSMLIFLLLPTSIIVLLFRLPFFIDLLFLSHFLPHLLDFESMLHKCCFSSFFSLKSIHN